MTEFASYTAADNLVLLPAIILLLFASGTILLDVIGRKTATRSDGWIVLFGLAGCGIAGFAILRQHQAMTGGGLNQLLAGQHAVMLDQLAFLGSAITVGATALFFLISYRYLEIRHENIAEYYALALLAQVGMYFMCTGAELVTLFLGAELAAICFYVLVGFTRRDRRTNEAAVKYLLLGAVSSGIMLYGFSLLYGVSGSTELSSISEAVARRGARDPIVTLAVVTVCAGLLFKIAAVPFHMWAPDAYDGAPTPVTALLSVASKTASFVLLLRLVVLTLAPTRVVWEPILLTAALLSITVGTIAALSQERLKRLLAYSAIAHAGYILLGVVAGNNTGIEGVYLYLIIYAVMTLGAFVVVITLNRHGIAGENLSDLRGLATNNPVPAALFVILLISLAGLPPTAGFIGKYYILLALVETGHYVLASAASAYIVVGLYFYFRLVREMYLQTPEASKPLATSLGTQLALGATSAVTLLVGVFPEPILRLGFQLTGMAQ